MTVAALLDLGASQEKLKSVLDTLPAEGFEIRCSRVKKAGIECMDFHVVLDAAHENHDHDMEYLHGHEASCREGNHGGEHHYDPQGEHAHTHDPSEEHHHAHGEHDHCHDHPEEHHHDQGEGHTHQHRGLREILEIIDACTMSEPARALAKKIFLILGEAEAKAHGVSPEEVHFHEVGAIDSIVDIISVAVCLDDLDVDRVIVPKLCEGSGTIRCQHGILSIPVPAVANILEAYGLPVEITGVKGELITPTGAAIAAAVCTGTKLPDRFVIKKNGLGAGKRTYERPSILRAMLIEEEGEKTSGVIKLESNIDDCTGEELGFVMELLFAAGARDVHYTPVFMKKNRPGYQLNVICMEEEMERLEEIIFRNTTTIGIRRIACDRSVLPREMLTVNTRYGAVQVKKCTVGDDDRFYPEYESIVEICRERGVSYREVYSEALRHSRQ